MSKDIKVVHLKPSQLKDGFDNPRKISKDALKDLHKSIETLGDFGVIVIDEGNNIISGSQRIKAMLDNNIDIPIVCKQLIGYTEKEKKAINVKANIQSGEWDYDKLDEWQEDLQNYEFISPLGINDPNAEWEGMPEYINEDKTSFRDVIVHFKNQEAIDKFAELLEQNITEKTKYLWYPKIIIEKYIDKEYQDEA